MFSDYKNIPHEANLLIYSGIFPNLAYGMFYTDLAYLLTEVRGISTGFMGVLITLMGVSMVVSSIPFGILADRYSRKKIMIFANIVASITIALFALTSDPTMLVIVSLLEGVSEAAYSAVGSALLADKATDEKRNSVFAFSGFTQYIAFGLGGFIIPVVAVFEMLGLTMQESHAVLYVVSAGLALSSTLIMLRVTESRPAQARKMTFRGLYPKNAGLLTKYLLTSVIIAFGAGLIIPLMSVWFQLQYGIPDTISGPILGISNLLIGVAALASPPIARRFGIVKAIALTQGVSTIFMLLTPLSPEFMSASIIYSMRSLLMNMASPLQQSMIMGIVPEGDRGIASGISSALWRLPNSLSTSIGAWMLGLGLLSAPFYLACVFYLVSILLFWGFFRNTKMPEEMKK